MIKRIRRAIRDLIRGPLSPMEEAMRMAMSVEGQISDQEVAQLIKLAQVVPERSVVVEIGSFRGRSTVALALGSKMGGGRVVYAVDPHFAFVGVKGGVFGPADQAELYRNINRAGVGEIVSVVSLPSSAAAKSWSGRNIGLLWIDGDHSYEGVRADLAAWRPWVVAGGTIAFHDSECEGVARLIREEVEAQRLRPSGRVDLISWFTAAD